MKESSSTRRRGARVIACALLALLAGCGSEQLSSDYGKLRGANARHSVNGTSVLAGLFERAGHPVRSWRYLSPRLHDEAGTIVWFPDDFQPPTQAQIDWLEEWLQFDDGRTLIYVGRDFDAQGDYWKDVQPKAAGAMLQEFRRREAAARTDHLALRAAATGTESCDWFKLSELPLATAGSLAGSDDWLAGIDPAQVRIEYRRILVPSESAEVLLECEGDILASVEYVGDSQRILVANGSWLLNARLINKEHRKLAAALVEQSSPGSHVYFLESSPQGPEIRESDPTFDDPTGLENLVAWPMSLIFLQLFLVGAAYIVSAFPIFGTARSPIDERQADFGSHVAALGDLLQQSGNERYAMARLVQYQQSHRSESAAEHRTTRGSTFGPSRSRRTAGPRP
jgi:hypothetical protein